MGQEATSYEPGTHYDRVTAAWTLLLGHELHYGLFDDSSERLEVATRSLTLRMLEAARIEPGQYVLDVGCGTGAPACLIARDTGAHVTGITTSHEGLAAALARSEDEGVADRVSFELRNGMDNGLPDASFDRVWVLESSHLMRRRDRLVSECARVLRAEGRIALCDIVLRRQMDFEEVKRLREPLALLRKVFGDARMEPLSAYRHLFESHDLVVDVEVDLSQQTRPTFARWRDNAERHRGEVVTALGHQGWRDFVESCDVLEGFWDDDTLGYGLIAADKPI